MDTNMDLHSPFEILMTSAVGVGLIECIHQAPLGFIHFDNALVSTGGEVIKVLCQVVVAYFTIQNLRKRKK